MIAALLHDRAAIVEAIDRRRSPARVIGGLLAVTSAGGALYGAALGCYVGGVQVPLAALKVPIALLATFMITFAAMHLVNVLCHPAVTAAQSLALTLMPLATMSAALAAAAPVVALLTLTMDTPSYPSYLFLILFAVFWGVAGGSLGIGLLRRELAAIVGPGGRVGRTVALWVAVYQFVGAQCIWMLRPWIGDSTTIEGYFSLTRNLKGNFYVAVWDAVVAFFQRIL